MRAIESIADNIAEGCGAATKKDFARYLDNAIKSANESENDLLAARDYELISHAEWENYNGEVIAIRKMVFSYRKKMLVD